MATTCACQCNIESRPAPLATPCACQQYHSKLAYNDKTCHWDQHMLHIIPDRMMPYNMTRGGTSAGVMESSSSSSSSRTLLYVYRVLCLLRTTRCMYVTELCNTSMYEYVTAVVVLDFTSTRVQVKTPNQTGAGGMSDEKNAAKPGPCTNAEARCYGANTPSMKQTPWHETMRP